MKRIITFCMLLSLITVFSMGCDKKATDAKKTETTVTTPEGSTTVTDEQKVETKTPPEATK
jgi:ABC-type Fe3+-citrate transport system substrate-binding protein